MKEKSCDMLIAKSCMRPENAEMAKEGQKHIPDSKFIKVKT